MLRCLKSFGGDRFALGIDIDIREHNRVAIEQHPMFKRIKMIQGSSVDKEVMRKVYEIASGKKRVMVALDSNHSHGHVLEELELYSPLVKKGSYVIVFDTIVEDMPEDFFPDRPGAKEIIPRQPSGNFLKPTTVLWLIRMSRINCCSQWHPMDT